MASSAVSRGTSVVKLSRGEFSSSLSSRLGVSDRGIGGR